MGSLASDLWTAPLAAAAVNADVRIPGSKSMTNRALMLAALADGPSAVRHPLRARDTALMAGALRALGHRIEETPRGWPVTPGPLRGPARVDVGLAGTVMRFVPPVAALARGDVYFDGDPQARKRPMGPILCRAARPRRTIDDAGRNALPFTVHGAGAMPGGTVDDRRLGVLPVRLRPAAGRCPLRRGREVRHVGPPVPSLAPHRP